VIGDAQVILDDVARRAERELPSSLISSNADAASAPSKQEKPSLYGLDLDILKSL